MPGPTTYSFADLTGAMTHPDIGAYIFAGDKMGIGEVMVGMTTEKTVIDTASDGGVMMSWVPGDAGQITIAMQQTCLFHKWLLNWINTLKILPVSRRFLSSMRLQSIADATGHVCIGIGPQKTPDKPYQQQGQKVSWVLLVGDIQNYAA